MTNCLKGHRSGGRRRGDESQISPHLRFTIPDLRRPTPDRVNHISQIKNLRPLSPSLHFGAPSRPGRRQAGRSQGPFKIKELSQKIRNRLSNPIKGLLMKKIPNFFTGTLMENYWQTREKPPKKPLKNGQKTRGF